MTKLGQELIAGMNEALRQELQAKVSELEAEVAEHMNDAIQDGQAVKRFMGLNASLTERVAELEKDFSLAIQHCQYLFGESLTPAYKKACQDIENYLCELSCSARQVEHVHAPSCEQGLCEAPEEKPFLAAMLGAMEDKAAWERKQWELQMLPASRTAQAFKVGDRVNFTIIDKDAIAYYGTDKFVGPIMRKMRGGHWRIEMEGTASQDSEGHNDYRDVPESAMRKVSSKDRYVDVDGTRYKVIAEDASSFCVEVTQRDYLGVALQTNMRWFPKSKCVEPSAPTQTVGQKIERVGRYQKARELLETWLQEPGDYDQRVYALLEAAPADKKEDHATNLSVSVSGRSLGDDAANTNWKLYQEACSVANSFEKALKQIAMLMGKAIDDSQNLLKAVTIARDVLADTTRPVGAKDE